MVVGASPRIYRRVLLFSGLYVVGEAIVFAERVSYKGTALSASTTPPWVVGRHGNALPKKQTLLVLVQLQQQCVFLHTRRHPRHTPASNRMGETVCSKRRPNKKKA